MRSGRKGRGRAAERDATSGIRRCPGSGRSGGEPGQRRRRPLSATPRTAGKRLRPAPSEGADCGPAVLPGWAVHTDLPVYPGADGAGVGGCCRRLEGVPGSDDAPAAGGRYRG